MKSKAQKQKEAVIRNTKRLSNTFVKAKYQKLGFEKTCMAMGLPRQYWYSHISDVDFFFAREKISVLFA